MSNPQQPELRRSGRDGADQDARNAKAADPKDLGGKPHGTDKGNKGGGRGGGVPPEQQPGWARRDQS